jgi:hypothetical protein
MGRIVRNSDGEPTISGALLSDVIWQLSEGGSPTEVAIRNGLKLDDVRIAIRYAAGPVVGTVVRRAEHLLDELEGLWTWLPLDRHESVAAALRRALSECPTPIEPRLGETGQITISRRALEEWCAETGYRPEQGRLELLRIVQDAKRIATGDADEHERWRVRRKGAVDLSVFVARREGAPVVVRIGTLKFDRRRPK